MLRYSDTRWEQDRWSFSFNSLEMWLLIRMRPPIACISPNVPPKLECKHIIGTSSSRIYIILSNAFPFMKSVSFYNSSILRTHRTHRISISKSTNIQIWFVFNLRAYFSLTRVATAASTVAHHCIIKFKNCLPSQLLFGFCLSAHTHTYIDEKRNKNVFSVRIKKHQKFICLN